MLLHRLLLPACLLLALAETAPAREVIQLARTPALSPDGATLAFEWNGDVWTAPVNGGAARPLTSHSGRDAEPRFSPDGKEIAFVSDRDGTAQVYVVPATGGVPKQLTFHSEGYSLLEWTPDGKSLLVEATRDHTWGRGGRFFRIARSERPVEELLFDDQGRDGSLSPDGKRLLFTREGEAWWRKGYHGSQASQIWMYDLESKTFTRVLAGDRSARWPMWRPDGKGFYYVAYQPNASQLCEYDLELKRSSELTRISGELVTFPCISRDGSALVYRQMGDLYRYHPGGKEPPRKIDLSYVGDLRAERKERRSVSAASDAAFTTDGLEIALVAGGDVWVMDTELREPRRVTATPGEERNPVFTPDGEAVYFLAESEGQGDVWKAERADPKQYWWQNRKFKVEKVTKHGDVFGGLRLTPDGKHLAYVRGRGELWLADTDGQNGRCLIKSWNAPDYDFSPDGKWLTYALSDNDFNRDVFLLSMDKDAKPLNVSRHPNNESNPVWSPDGALVAFSGARASTGEGVVISIVYLRAGDNERSVRDRTLERALEKIDRARKPGSRPSTDPSPRKTPEVKVDDDGMRDRIRRVTLGDNSRVRDLFWSPDGKKLAFTGSYNDQAGTFTIDIGDQMTPRLLAAAAGTRPRWLRTGNQIVWLAGGSPGSLSATASPSSSTPSTATPPTGGTGRRPGFGRGPTTGGTETASAGTTYRFSVTQEVDLTEKYAAGFDQCWRIMRDNWYDERMGNQDWTAVRKKYRTLASEAADADGFATAVQLMLGELNGSHLGFRASSGRSGRPDPGPQAPVTPTPTPTPTPEPPQTPTRTPAEVTAHLGVRFDPAHEGPGLKIKDVIPRGPAERKNSRLHPGEVILSIDGVEVSLKKEMTAVLNGPLTRELALKVKGDDGKERDVVLRPTTYAAARQALYDMWLRDNQKKVEEASKGSLGYLHIRAMNMQSFSKFEEELYSVGAGKDGLVIDVRENGGGSTTDHLLTALTQPVHAVTVGRGGGQGYPHDRKVYATWNKPIVVLCNQNSFSNAEIFSHAIKTLKRGQLVGTPTAGGVVSTGATQVMDLGSLRLPFRGWYLVNSGEDMEMHGAVPDHIVWPEPGDWGKGHDAQLNKAVEVLLSDVTEWKKKAQPNLKKASERQPSTATSSK